MGISQFHMADFEARQKPFDTWTNLERKNRLNVLLEIIGTAKPHCYGFTNLMRPGDSTSSIYERCAHDVFVELSTYDDEFAIVFAHHPEYGRQSILLDKLAQYGMGKQIRSCSIMRPIDTCPLQAADIVAFELRCQEREQYRPRYPLERLNQFGCRFRFGASAD
jgi:hypothetical protein